MNRRGFLGALLGGVAALAVDEERLLWVPGKRLISIPKPSINLPLTEAEITQAVLNALQNNLKLIRYVNKDYEASFKEAKIDLSFYPGVVWEEEITKEEFRKRYPNQKIESWVRNWDRPFTQPPNSLNSIIGPSVNADDIARLKYRPHHDPRDPHASKTLA
jgi:hypothetical protein